MPPHRPPPSLARRTAWLAVFPFLLVGVAAFVLWRRGELGDIARAMRSGNKAFLLAAFGAEVGFFAAGAGLLLACVRMVGERVRYRHMFLLWLSVPFVNVF